MRKRVISLIMTICMLFAIPNVTVLATQDRSYNFNKNYTLTGNYANDIVNVANAQLGKTKSSLGYTEAWCADFVTDCARLTGMPDNIIPYNYASRGACKYLYDYMINYCNAQVVSNRQAGDLVFYYCPTCGTYPHVGIVLDGTYSIEGNINNQVYKIGGNNGYYIDSNNHKVSSGQIQCVYVRPNYGGGATTPPSAPTGAWMWSSKTIAAVNEEISFNYNASGATGFVLGIDKDGMGRISTVDAGGSDWYTTSFSSPGKYTIYATCYNSAGGMDSNTVTFYIYEKADWGKDFYAVILNTAYWKPLEVCDDNYVRLGTEHGWAKNLWKFERESDGSYKIISAYNGKVLDAYNQEQSNHTPILTYLDQGGNNQRWYIYYQGDGFVLKPKHVDRILDLNKNHSDDGTDIQLYDPHNGPSQIFTIYNDNDILMTSPTLNVKTNENSATFTWEEVYGENQYNLKIWKGTYLNGDPYYSKKGASSPCVVNDLPPGYYEAYVDAVNSLEFKMSNVVSFTIESTTIPSTPTQEPTATPTPTPMSTPTGTVVTASSVSTSQDGTVDVKIDLSGNKGFANLGIQVGYDANALTLISATNNPSVGAVYTPAQQITANPYNMGWDSTGNITYNGNLATLTFKVKENAVEGKYPITVSYYTGKNGDYKDGTDVNYDEDFNALKLSYVNGAVTVSSHTPGDINGDGKVNNQDGTFLLRHLAGWNVNIDESSLDVNGDGKVNNQDGTVLLRYLAGWQVNIH